jgi:hypothetical protein
MTEFFRFVLDSPVNFFGSISLMCFIYVLLCGFVQCCKSKKK